MDTSKKMVVKQLTYSRLFNLNNFENEKIELQVELNDDDNIDMVLKGAREWVEANSLLVIRAEKKKNEEILSKLRYAKRIINDSSNQSCDEVVRCKDMMKIYEKTGVVPEDWKFDLPF